MSRMVRVAVTMVIPGLILGACADTNGPSEGDEAVVTADVAAVVADATVDDVALMTAEADDATQASFRDRCNRIGFRFRCPRRAFDDISIEREVTFFDRDGETQDGFDPIETERIQFVVTVSGERTRPNWSVALEQERDFTVSGLADEETSRTWNGSGQSTIDGSRHTDDGRERTYDMTSTVEVTDVVIAVPRAGTWPLSGTITRNVVIEVVNGIDDPRTRERTATVTFNGTQFVPIEINGEMFTLDLATRRIVKDET